MELTRAKFPLELLHLHCLLAVQHFVRTSVLLLAALSQPIIAPAETIQISLRSGSLIHVDVEQTSFPWTDVNDTGETIPRDIPFAEIRHILLTEFSVNQQVSRLKRMLAELRSDDYQARESAEDALSETEFSAKFETMIRAELDAADLETKYRLQRVLAVIERASPTDFDPILDILVMRDGTVLRGDAARLEEVVGRFRGQSIRIPMREISRFGFEKSPADNPVAPADSATAIAVQTFNAHHGQFYLDNQTWLGFENDPFGGALSLQRNLHTVFALNGVLLRTEVPGYIRSYGMKWHFCPIESGERCAIVYDTSDPLAAKRFRGVFVISFCVPGHPEIPAGVHEAGVFVERVSHSRDVIVEAYDAVGRMLGMVEATDRQCIFAGFKSNLPIASLRILRNPDLPDVGRDVDELFAVDNLVYERIQPIYSSAGKSSTRVDAPWVHLKSGDILAARRMSLDKNQILFDNPVGDDPERIAFPTSDLHAIQFNLVTREVPPATDGQRWMVALDDGSILRTKSGDEFASEEFEGLSFSPDEIVGLWRADSAARFATNDQFNAGLPVAVFPSCAIVLQGFEFTGDGVRWDLAKSEKIVQKVNIPPYVDEPKVEPEQPDSDLTPSVDRLLFSDADDWPTIWLRPPRQIDSRKTRLTLKDGQQWVFGTDTGIKLESLGHREFVVSVDNKQYPIGLDRIASIEFGQNTSREGNE
jgi:hypothetical protein